MEIKIENESVTTDFQKLKKYVPEYQEIDPFKTYSNKHLEILQYLKYCLEDINELWEDLDLDLKIIKEIQKYDRGYIDIEKMCKQARCIQTVMLNVEASIYTLGDILKKESE